MASAKCNDLVTRLNDAKNKANQAFEQLGRIKGLIEQTENQAELVELEERRLDISQLANEAARYADALLQQAKQFNCGPDIESKINAELNYARNVFNQISTLGGELARKINALGLKKKQEADAKAAAEAAKDSQKATTTQDNAGTGKPGTAGTGAGATPSSDELNEVAITSKKRPAPVDPLTEPIDTGPINVDEPKINTGDNLVVDEPGLQGVGDIDVDAPNFNLEQEEGGIDTNQGVPGATQSARSQATNQDTTNFKIKEDWRVRLSLSPGATYLYKDPENKLLSPLSLTDGVIFPYTPSIAVNYNASYGTTNPAHSNYTIYQYQNSNVDSVTLTCDFTAQDTYEANYLLAVIHFFKSVTKMFYGKDENPKQGTPPPLVYLFGLGEFQFNAHPLAVTGFSYNLPNNVDYIRAGEVTSEPGVPRTPDAAPSKAAANGLGAVIRNAVVDRLSQGASRIGARIGLTLTPGGSLAQPGFGIANGFNSYQAPGTVEPTYVPTQITMTVTCIPIVSRYEISNNFSLKDYSSGKLLQGVKRAGGGFW